MSICRVSCTIALAPAYLGPVAVAEPPISESTFGARSLTSQYDETASAVRSFSFRQPPSVRVLIRNLAPWVGNEFFRAREIWTRVVY